MLANYLNKNQFAKAEIKEKPKSNLKTVIVIPSYDEQELTKTLDSLWKCKRPVSSVEVIIVINSSEKETKEIILRNEETEIEVKKWIASHKDATFRFHCINKKKLPKKHAGVGLARKIGMDEAINRFALIKHKKGIIVSLDADCLVLQNYLVEIEKFFEKNPKGTACSIYYEHPISGRIYPRETLKAIIEYELYLRYYNLSLRAINFPFAFHTIGSAFAVRANIYAKQGGMNRKRAGEDFYFLQKIIALGNFGELNTTKVIPSPRFSARVPFGTGASLRKREENNEEIKTYNFSAFEDLKIFLKEIPNFRNIDDRKDFDRILLKVPKTIAQFLRVKNFYLSLKKINKNTKTDESFVKRFHAWFNSFRVLKFLNFAHEFFYQKINVSISAEILLKKYIDEKKEVKNMKELLVFFRKIEKNRK